MLLEVVIAVGLLVLGLAVIGAQFQNSYAAANQNERTVRSLMLAESKLAELDTGLILPNVQELTQEDFGAVFPEYAWRLKIEPTQTPDLNAITIEILYQPGRKIEEQFDFEGGQVVQTLYTFRATPSRIDLQRDFGLDDEQAVKLTDSLGGGGFNPNDVDPRMFAEMDIKELIEVLPALLEAFGMSMDQISGQLPPELRDAIEQFQQNGGEQNSSDGSGGKTGGTTGGTTGAATGGKGAGTTSTGRK